MSLRTLAVAVLSCASLAGSARAQNAPAEPVVIMGQIAVKPERATEFLKIVQDMTARVKREDKGNIRYELFAVAPLGRGAAPAASTVNNYVFIEEWESQAAFTAHGAWAGPIVQNQWRPLAEKVDLVRLSRAKLAAVN
jgi:quinol monooxygenase YgiN